MCFARVSEKFNLQIREKNGYAIVVWKFFIEKLQAQIKLFAFTRLRLVKTYLDFGKMRTIIGISVIRKITFFFKKKLK